MPGHLDRHLETAQLGQDFFFAAILVPVVDVDVVRLVVEWDCLV